MLGAAIPSPAHFALRDHAGGMPTIVHLAPTRSATIRLAPVAAALRARQVLIDSAGRIAEWSLTKAPPLGSRTNLTPTEFSGAVTSALDAIRPSAVLIAGDDDAAIICALAAMRAEVPIARVGAGQRCGDRAQRREINRIAIDHLATRLYTDGDAADERLRAEGFSEDRVLQVGSTLAASVARWRGPALERMAWSDIGVVRGEYVVVDLNRPESFVDAGRLVDAVETLAKRHRVVVSARTRSTFRGVARSEFSDYVEFLSLLAGAGAVVTDSAGVQEESTVLGVSCFTLATASERTVTLTHGTNTLLGDDPAAIADVTIASFNEAVEPARLWDGDVGRRIAADLLDTPWSCE